MPQCPKCRRQYPSNSIMCPRCKIRFDNIVYQQPQNQQYYQQPQQMMTAEQMQLSMQAQQLQLQLQQQQMQSMARCPRCGSTSLCGNKKGYGVVKGAAGATILGAVFAPAVIVGLAAGNMGARKVKVTCMQCGYRYKA